MAVEKSPKVSVILPVYNCEKYLQYAIESILDQTFKNFELLILDDGSTDKSSEIAKRYADKDRRIRYFYHPNMGLTKTLNKGLKLARGVYIARQDADDISHPERLEKQVKYLEEHPEIALVGTWYYLINDQGKIIKYKKYPHIHRKIAEILIKKRKNILPHTSIMFRKNIVCDIIEGYNPLFKRAQDYNLYLELLSYGFKIASIPEFLVYHRVHKDSVSKNKSFYESRMYGLFSLLCYTIKQKKDSYFTEKLLKQFVEKYFNSYIYRYVTYRYSYENFSFFKKIIGFPKLVFLKFLALYDEQMLLRLRDY